MHAGPLMPLVRMVTLPVGLISISSSSCAIEHFLVASEVPHADLHRSISADFLIHDRHVPFLQFRDHAVVDVLLRDAADQFFADLAQLCLGMSLTFNAQLQCAAL